MPEVTPDTLSDEMPETMQAENGHPGNPDTAMPVMVKFLGYAGLLPFFASALAVHLLPGALANEAAAILLAYGCVILSFLGGIGWGVGLLVKSDPSSLFVAGVLPSLLAVAAWLIPGPSALVMLVLGYVAMFLLHRGMAQAHGLPPWFVTLRLHLSAGASLSLIVGLAL